MFKKILIKGAEKNLELLGSSGILKDAYLAGGTAAALQLRHRISVNFDFFTMKEFEPKVFCNNSDFLNFYRKDAENAKKLKLTIKKNKNNFSRP